MSTTTVREIVEQERAKGIDDHRTAGLLRASKIPPPEGFFVWSVVAIREGVFGTDASIGPTMEPRR